VRLATWEFAALLAGSSAAFFATGRESKGSAMSGGDWFAVVLYCVVGAFCATVGCVSFVCRCRQWFKRSFTTKCAKEFRVLAENLAVLERPETRDAFVLDTLRGIRERTGIDVVRDSGLKDE
jgi:hypothetical protein